MTKYRKLKGRIKEVCDTQRSFANAMGISYATINQRLNGSKEWKMSEITKACTILNIPIEDAHMYFFYTKSIEN